MAGPGSRLTWLPLSAAIDLHEIHLARQSSLQVPVGHIPVPGGIKLCSPGTFLVANYLIINNGSFQVNFTKSKRATIRYTNSQCPRGVGSEVLWKGSPCRRPSRRLPSPRRDGSGVLMGMVAVPKSGRKNSLPRRVGSGAPVGRVAVPKTVQKPPFATPGWL